MAGKGLFAVVGPPEESGELDDEYPEDMMSSDDEDGSPADDVPAGPFDSYADTVINAEADPEERKEALRQAIMTLIEERGPV